MDLYINAARPPPGGGCTAVFLFLLFDMFMKRVWGNGRFPRHTHIPKQGLIRYTPGFCFVDGRDGRYCHPLL
jgi:hypothetical protein